MGYYLLNKELEDINSYCKSRCKKLVNEYTKSTVSYYRGQYKGYLYGIKITHYLITKKIKITHMQLYKTIKDEKNRILNIYISDVDYARGLKDTLYDLMNFVSSTKII